MKIILSAHNKRYPGYFGRVYLVNVSLVQFLFDATVCIVTLLSICFVRFACFETVTGQG